MFKNIIAAAAMLAVCALSAQPAAAEAAKAKDLVRDSKESVELMSADQNIGENVRKYLKKAKGVLIVPQVIKGAFMIGGEGGSGVMLVKNKKGTWSYPAFYTMGAVSFGLQVGGSSSQVILLLMTDKGVDSIVDGSRIKLGADLGVAVGPVGGGAEVGVTLASADVLVYSVSKGAYLGISLEGSVIEPRETLNKENYGAEVGSKPIVIERKYSNAGANGLRAALLKAQK